MTRDVLKNGSGYINRENSKYNSVKRGTGKRAARAFVAFLKKENKKSEENIYSGKKVCYITHKAQRAPFPVSFVLLAVTVTLICMFLVMNYSKVNVYTRRINELENNIAQYKTEQARLNILLNQKDDLRLIEERATKTLGMVKFDNLEKLYVGNDGQDKIEVIKQETKEAKLGIVMSGMLQVLSDFISGEN